MAFRSAFSPVLRRLTARIVPIFLLFVVANGTATAKSSSLLWKISGNGLEQPSYLYGTIHIKDKRVFEFTEATTRALAATPAFAMELNPDSISFVDMLPLMMLDSGRTLKSLLPEEDYQLVHSKLKEKMGVQALVLEKMKPVFIASLLSLDNTNQDYETSLDEHLFQKAKDANKKVYGIETAAEQMQAFDVMTLEEQAQMLVEQVRDEAKDDSSTAMMIQAYIDADLDKLMELIGESEIKGDVYEALLTKRNHIMADRISRMTTEQPVFAAIGSGHLAGEEGVIALLRKKGYTVEPVR